MEGFGHIGGLATIVATSGISPTKTVTDAQNNTALIQAMANNGVIRGEVKSRGINNTVTIRTDQGSITIQTDVFLKRGAEVALKIEQRAAEAFIRIVSVDGQSLGKYLESLSGQASHAAQDKISTSSNLIRPDSSAATSTTSSLPTSSQMPSSSPVDALIRGVFLSQPSFSSAQRELLPPPMQQTINQASTGTSLQIRVLNILAPNPNGQGFIPLSANAPLTPGALPSMPTASTPAGDIATPANYLSAQQRLQAAPQIQAALQNQQASQTTMATLSAIDTPSPSSSSGNTATTGTPVSTTTPTGQPAPSASTSQMAQPAPTGTPSPIPPTISPTPVTAPPVAAPPDTLATPIPASNTTSSLPPPPSPTAFSAVVLESGHGRELTLQSDFGTFKIFVTTRLPKGSVIHFEFQHAAQVRGGTGETAPSHTTTLQSFDAIKTLESHYHSAPPIPQGNTTVLPALVPRPGPLLSTELLFLMTALQGSGSLRQWLGQDTLNRLESQQGSDFMQRLAGEFASLRTIPADSRDGQWHQFMVPLHAEGRIHPIEFYYKRQRQRLEQDIQDTDHFMVDLELTRMGRMQLDGLVQRQATAFQFDLIIRTAKEWDISIQDDIRNIYLRAQDISGFQGSMHFRHGADSLLTIPVDNTGKQTTNTQSIIV